MERVKMAEDLSFSRIVHGLWRLAEWDMSAEETVSLIEQCLELGITTFDHADIYGDYTCESLFGKALELDPTLRDKMQIVTKCGIKLLSSKFPERSVKRYDTSREHIIMSAEQSLNNLKTDFIDVLLIHRPDPYMNPEEVAEAFSILKQQGKVKYFGVSNFTPSQINMLQSYLDFPLVTNQVEISAMHVDTFQDGTIEHCLENRIAPMAWSPLAGGKIFSWDHLDTAELRRVLTEVGEETGVDSVDKLMYAWLLNHPARIIPIVGSGKIERITAAAESVKIKLSREQWFKIWIASIGHDVA
ncbi:aldo/keto reductase family oxidoreductase [Neobacillus sp. PS3-34]|uniref:aldo/keto reductase n=1 Tax=Neobacillus sp. PS3-34 TaxID=3070678 RepID=UPI0027E1F4A5|nr:aldo/keto reductase family oxidoreductase [Neobacillus sp. PS3-34]WML50544.1 aldo/keto reductase family oxidoreductase [Neobacillus sp. PS3-34]